MKKVYCESCEALQPNDWKPGDFCTSCGNVSRKEAHCAWCVHKVPMAKFCRDCGFKMVEPDWFGVARMLKDGNVDKLSIADKIAAMDQETLLHYQSIYNQHYAVMMNRVEEVQFFQKFTVYKNYAEDLKNQLLKDIPFSEELLNFLKSGSQGPFNGQTEKILESLEHTPLKLLKDLAPLASIHISSPDWPQEHINQLIPKLFEDAISIPNSPQGIVEYFAALSNPDALMLYIRKRQESYKISRLLQPKVISFVEKYWNDLDLNVQSKVIPFVYQFRFLKELRSKQDAFENALNKAFLSNDQNLALSAAIAYQKSDWLLKFTQSHLSEKVKRFAAESIGFYSVEKACLNILQGNETLLKESVIEGLYRRNKPMFSEVVSKEIAAALERYVSGREQPKMKEAIFILSKINSQIAKKESQENKETSKLTNAVGRLDKSAEVLSLFDETTDIPVCNALLEKLEKYPLNKEVVKAIKTKLVFFKLDFNESLLQKLFDFGKTEAQSNVESILDKVVGQGSTSSFKALKLIWNALLFENGEETYRNFFYSTTFDKPNYVHIESGKIEQFKIDKTSIELFFGEQNRFFVGFLQRVTQSPYSEEYYRFFWKDKEADWENLVRQNEGIKSLILDGLLTLIENVDQPEVSIEKKTWTLEFLRKTFDLFDKPMAERLAMAISKHPPVSKTKYKGAFTYLVPLQELLLSEFGISIE